MISEAPPPESRVPNEEAPPRPLRRGILIDVDGALFLDKIGYWVGLIVSTKSRPALSQRLTLFQGTFVFMSSAILIHGSSKKHKPSDDLESFVYVLIYLCIRYAGPDNSPHVDAPGTIESMQFFCADQVNANAIGRYKKHVLSAKGALERDILPHFSLYFEDLKPCVVQLRDAFTKNKHKFTYDAVLDVLRATRDALPAVEAWSPQDDPVGYGLQAKRSRDPSAESCRLPAPKRVK
jgi:hypothetical protein